MDAPLGRTNSAPGLGGKKEVVDGMRQTGKSRLSRWFTKVNIFLGPRDFMRDAFHPCESLTTDLVTNYASSWDLSLINCY